MSGKSVKLKEPRRNFSNGLALIQAKHDQARVVMPSRLQSPRVPVRVR
jgi:hypothetical protein